MGVATSDALSRRVARQTFTSGGPDKTEMTRLLETGCYGNYLKTWQTLHDLTMSGYTGWLTIRAREKGSPWFVSEVHSGEPLSMALQAIRLRGGPAQEAFYFQQVPNPGAHRVMNLEGGYDSIDTFELDLVIETDVTTPVRGIRERGRRVKGAVAWATLRSRLHPGSVDDLISLWESYPDAIIEATEFSSPCGVFNRPLVIWELRERY